MPGPAGILSQLTPAQQETLISWMESLPIKEVLANVGKCPPAGFGLRTHITSLRRFYHRWHRDQGKRDFDAALRQLDPERLAELEDAAVAAAVQQVLQTSTASDPSGRNLARVTRWVLTLQKRRWW